MATKRILKHIRKTCDHGLLLPNKSGCHSKWLVGHSNSNWCGDEDDRMSNSGYFLKFEDVVFT